ncbi:MAG: hypothetical protein HQK83_10365 [Fibrobacteria bacterium]|nr:hypothetical protein [Fibrobacteria bacterium]
MYKRICLLFLLISLFIDVQSYPVDGYAATGIRRLERLRLIQDGKQAGKNLPAGALKQSGDIRLHLDTYRSSDSNNLWPADARLQKKIEALFHGRHGSYSLSVLVLNQGTVLGKASVKDKSVYQPGSVAKISVAAGLLAELKTLFPDSVNKRIHLLKTRMVTAEDWIISDHHDVPLFDIKTEKKSSRPIKSGDVFSLYEWLDHMLSASSNAAASTVWKEAMLIRAYGKAYPPSSQEEKRFFTETPKKELVEIAKSVVNSPFLELGIPESEWKLGSFFTGTGKRKVPGGGTGGTTSGMLKILTALERGMLVDKWSSLELKKLLYMTARRIRYASAPSLTSSAVYFKSGSLYKCKSEPEFKCGKYKGNVNNYMNSVAIVERPDGIIYLVALMSNVLRLNSAVEHQTLATMIDRIITSLYGATTPEK